MLTAVRSRLHRNRIKPRYLLGESFAGAGVPGIFAVQDTENKLSFAGELICAGGIGAPGNYNNPRLVSPAHYRAGGLTAEWHIKPSAGSGMALGLSHVNPPDDSSDYNGFRTWTSNRLYAESYDGENIDVQVPLLWASPNRYVFYAVALPAGYRMYVSRDNGVSRLLVWLTDTGATASLVSAIGNYDLVFRSKLARFYRRTPKPTVVSLAPAATVPSLGAETVNSWTNSVAFPFETFAADGQTITQAVNTTGYGGAYTDLLTVAGWCKATFTLTQNSGTRPNLTVSSAIDGGGTVSYAKVVLDAGANAIYFRALTSTVYADIWSGFGIASDFSIADFSIKPIALASCLTRSGTADNKNIIARCNPVVAAGSQAGLAVLADVMDGVTDPAYLLYAITDRTNVTLIKRVNNVETVLITTATGVTYADSRELRIIAVPAAGNDWATASVGVYYATGGTLALIGTLQTVDLSAFGYECGGVDPSGTNSVGTVTVDTGVL